MKRTIPAILLFVTFAWPVFGQNQASPPPAKRDQAALEAEFAKIENQWAEADKSKDAVALGLLLANDWTYLGPFGSETKAQHLAALQAGTDKLESITLMDMKVRVYGNTAVVTGHEHEKSSSGGKDTSGDYMWTDVFVNRQGHWLAVNSQDTPFTKK